MSIEQTENYAEKNSAGEYFCPLKTDRHAKHFLRDRQFSLAIKIFKLYYPSFYLG